jgi:hypothetical protein
MTRLVFNFESTSVGAILKWADKFNDNGWLDIKHGKISNVGTYSLIIEESTEVILP